MLQLAKISFSFAALPILREVTWPIHPGRHYGLVGPNGVGKSTLLRIMAGEIKPDEGHRILPTDFRVGYLPQEGMGLSGRTVLDEAMTVFSDIFDLGEKLHTMERQMADPSHTQEEHDQLMARYAKMRDDFERHGGYALEHKARSVLFGLGFCEGDLSRLCDEFSGGWQCRIGLARLLLTQPHVLLLDEPTNHLDLPAVEWLEQYLLDYPGAIVTISHDRRFLDRLVDEIVSLWNEKLTSYKGNFTNYQIQREKEEEQLHHQHKEQRKKIDKTQQFIDRFRADAKKRNMVQSRIKHLEKLEQIEIPPPPPVVHFRFPAPPDSAKVILSLSETGYDYGKGPVFSDFDCDVIRGRRIGIVGPNGSGKTTLLRVLSGELKPTSGTIRIGSRVVRATFSQDQGATLKGSHTVLSELENTAKGEWTSRVRGLLGVFLFTGDEVDKPVGVLSGGEKSRVSLARILCAGANVLLLDEPTNHLDLTTRSSLEEALRHFSGSVIMISHDRYFLDRVAEEIWEVKDGGVKRTLGNYSDYISIRDLQAAKQEPANKKQDPTDNDRRENRRQQRQGDAVIRQRFTGARKKLQKTIQKMERTVEALELEREQLDEKLADPDMYNDGEKSRQLVSRRRAIDAELDHGMAAWEKSQAELDELESDLARELQ
jgi:ATP-binding cassette, subfamily F, member 3